MLRRIVEAETEDQRNAALDKLQEGVIQDMQFANDEGDPGMGLELGMPPPPPPRGDEALVQYLSCFENKCFCFISLEMQHIMITSGRGSARLSL